MIVTINPRGTLGLSGLQAAFTRCVKDELRRLSKSGRVYGALSFLHTVSDKIYRRDLARYDMHMERGLTYRKVAVEEALDRTGRSKRPSQHPVGFRVHGEKNVEKSVRRIYEAIHRQPYIARARRSSARAENLPEFWCPTHERACPDTSCPNLARWVEQARAALPTDRTGTPSPWLLRQLKRQPPLD